MLSVASLPQVIYSGFQYFSVRKCQACLCKVFSTWHVLFDRA